MHYIFFNNSSAVTKNETSNNFKTYGRQKNYYSCVFLILVYVICSGIQDIDLHSTSRISTSITVMNSIILSTQTELVITFLGL